LDPDDDQIEKAGAWERRQSKARRGYDAWYLVFLGALASLREYLMRPRNHAKTPRRKDKREEVDPNDDRIGKAGARQSKPRRGCDAWYLVFLGALASLREFLIAGAAGVLA
jgi:hypothetical protein